MVKIKGWDKVWSGNRLRWDNRITKNSLVIQEDKVSGWQVILFDRLANKIIEIFKTKERAISYAYTYMKRHPNG